MGVQWANGFRRLGTVARAWERGRMRPNESVHVRSETRAVMGIARPLRYLQAASSAPHGLGSFSTLESATRPAIVRTRSRLPNGCRRWPPCSTTLDRSRLTLYANAFVLLMLLTKDDHARPRSTMLKKPPREFDSRPSQIDRRPRQRRDHTAIRGRRPLGNGQRKRHDRMVVAIGGPKPLAVVGDATRFKRKRLQRFDR